MLVKTGTCEADYHGAFYTFRGRAFQVGENPVSTHAYLTAISNT